MRYPGSTGRIGAYGRELLAALRLRRKGRSPHVRVRLADGQAELLAADSPRRERLLSLAAELVAEDAASRRSAG